MIKLYKTLKAKKKIFIFAIFILMPVLAVTYPEVFATPLSAYLGDSCMVIYVTNGGNPSPAPLFTKRGELLIKPQSSMRKQTS